VAIYPLSRSNYFRLLICGRGGAAPHLVSRCSAAQVVMPMSSPQLSYSAPQASIVLVAASLKLKENN
jgi:hypothetical protein